MKAWQLHRLGRERRFNDVHTPAGGVVADGLRKRVAMLRGDFPLACLF